jgi:hypothetical protein
VDLSEELLEQRWLLLRALPALHGYPAVRNSADHLLQFQKNKRAVWAR